MGWKRENRGFPPLSSRAKPSRAPAEYATHRPRSPIGRRCTCAIALVHEPTCDAAALDQPLEVEDREVTTRDARCARSLHVRGEILRRSIQRRRHHAVADE